MSELNPQIGRQTKVLAVSPGMLPNITVFHKKCDPWIKKILIDEMPILMDTEEGKQIMLMYKIDDVIIASDTDLDTLKALLLEYQVLKAKN